MDYGELAKTAIDKLMYSYTPYSGFNVAAALLTEEGRVYTGVNIENAAYTPSNCAERTAFFKAVSEGERHFKAIAIAGCRKSHLDTKMYAEGKIPDYCPPCGVCRQVMREFCSPEDFDVILVRSSTDYKVMKLKELLPESFGPEFLA
jgi:cytidine deaminase